MLAVIVKNISDQMDFRKWQEEQQKLSKVESNSLPTEKFFSRKKELAELRAFVDSETQKTFCLYGVPLIGKTTLVREFCKSLDGYKQITIKFNNPESPEMTLEKALSKLKLDEDDKLFIVIENFEETLLWNGDQEHLHEIKFPKVKQFIQSISSQPNIKLLLESRFQIKNDFIPIHSVTELSTRQLGKIDRKDLFDSLNKIYRGNGQDFDDFEAACEALNDHIWLIELAMKDGWLYENIREATLHPESLTQKLWERIQEIVRKLSVEHRTLLCAFGIVNPMSETLVNENLQQIPAFSRKDDLNNALLSLRKKLLLVYDAKNQLYELNPFLREVCFTYLLGQKEMQLIEKIPFFKNAQKPQYDSIIQAFEKGDYFSFFKGIKEKRRSRKFDDVHYILKDVFWKTTKPIIILNEIAVTYKWQKNYPKAIDTLERALKINDKDVKTLNELAIIYKEQKDYPKAIQTLEKALKEEPENVKVLNELGIVYKEQKDYPKAIETLEKACALGNIHSYNELAIVYKEQKNYPKAIETLEKACALGNVHSYTELAIVYKEQENYPKAIEILEKALIKEPEGVKLLTELAIVYKEQNNYPKAIETLEKALKVNGKDVKTLNELAIVCKEAGDYTKAKETANMGLSIERDNIFLKTTLSQINKAESDKKNNMPKSTLEKQKILFIAANPSNESRLQTDSEYRIIKAEIKRGTHRDTFEFLQPQLAVTITELLRALNEKPQIIHFSGHGDKSGIIITTEDNKSLVLPISAMERLFKPLKDVAKIVVLNSCYSTAQAKSISEYGMYVVGNNLPIGDKAAIDFAKGLYNGLSEGKQFESAFNDAMVVVLTESPKYLAVIEVWKDGTKLAL